MAEIVVVVTVLVLVTVSRRSNGPARATDAARATKANVDFIVDSCRMDCKVEKNDSVEYDRNRVTKPGSAVADEVSVNMHGVLQS